MIAPNGLRVCDDCGGTGPASCICDIVTEDS
jgi:hypothetical protein